MCDIGKVLFFDHKKGWGFIKIIKSDNENTDKDVFTHFSSIVCRNNFKKLFPGEYVSLDVYIDENETDENKKLKSKNITGVFGNAVVGLIDSRTRFLTTSLISMVLVFALVPSNGAWIHDYWNFPILLTLFPC